MLTEEVCKIALQFPGVEEGTSYGTVSFHVRKKLLVRFHQDGESLVLKIDPASREMLMAAEPETFSITEHYRNYPQYVLARLAVLQPDEFEALFAEAWERLAPKQLAEEFRREQVD